MPTTSKPAPARGIKGSRQAVDLFGATDEAAEEIDGTVFLDDIKASFLRSSLRHAAGYTITCPVTGQVLDASTVVVATLSVPAQGEVARALSPAGWASVGQDLVAALVGAGGTVKVLSERHIRQAIRAGKAGS